MTRHLMMGLCVALAACGDAPEEEVEAEAIPLSGCDPLDASICALPFPSSHFLVRDTETPSGYRVNFGEESLPEANDREVISPGAWNQRDGFSISSAMITYIPEVSLAGTASTDDIGASLADDSKTVVWDATEGRKVAHWVEFDDTAPSVDQRVLILRPAEPLDFEHHYVVGLRGLETEAGDPVTPSEAFLAHREGTESTDNDILGRRADFEEVIFPALKEAGFSRDELQLAWDFRTASRQNTIGDYLHVRDDMIGALPADGPSFELVEREDFSCDDEGQDIARTLRYEVEVPYYTTEPSPGSKLARGEDGLPERQGLTTAPVTIMVPCSVAESPEAASAPVVQYGHGLLGSHEEVTTGWMREFINEAGYVAVASPWTGFAQDDVIAILAMLNGDIGDFSIIPERSTQGFLGMMAVTKALKGDLSSAPDLLFGEEVAVINADEIGYYGNSQGGIMGAAYLAMSPDVTRGVLGVPGGPYSLLLPRSKDFDPFFSVFKARFDDHRDISLIVVGLTQQLWDPAEPSGWLWEMRRDGAEEKEVLLQVAIGDNQVTTLGAHYMARAYGAKSVGPAPREIWGVETSEETIVGAAIAEWDYSDIPDEPMEAIPPEGPDTHECPRRALEAQLQVRDFLEVGDIRQYCEGPCVAVQATCR